MGEPDTPSSAVLMQAKNLTFSHGAHVVLGPLNFGVGPGLTWVCGGDGRGKTTLLRLMAGQLLPTTGTLTVDALTEFDESCQGAALNETVAQDWLSGLQHRFPQWDHTATPQLGRALGLAEHLHKPFYMLSAGSRRKVGLLAAAVSGAQLTLLDTPFAALDAPSCRVLVQLLTDASQSRSRAWVVADYQRPALGSRCGPVTLIDLGD